MKKLCIILVFTILFFSLAVNTFGWGTRTHVCIGGAATDWEWDPVYPDANNGPDICHFIFYKDLGFAHGDIEFAYTMIEVAKGIMLPSTREVMLKLAYGWGSHIEADRIAHGQMLPPEKFDTIEHGLVELGVDWWLWNEGDDFEQKFAKRGSVIWSPWLVYETSRRYEEGIIWPWEVDFGGFALSTLVAGETIIMLMPRFYELANDYSDDTRSLLEEQQWLGFYYSSISAVEEWLLQDFTVAPVAASSKPKPFGSNTQTFQGNFDQKIKGDYSIIPNILSEVGERAIELGGIQRSISHGERYTRIAVNVKDPHLCQVALMDIVNEKLKTASGNERKFLSLLSNSYSDIKKSSIRLGEIKAR